MGADICTLHYYAVFSLDLHEIIYFSCIISSLNILCVQCKNIFLYIKVGKAVERFLLISKAPELEKIMKKINKCGVVLLK